MDLRAYLGILKRRGWIILVTALLAMVLAGGLSLLQTKTYRATARISAVPARPDWGLGSSAKDLLRSFVLNINTHDMANQVIAAANLDMSSYDLLSKLTVSAEPENFAIRIDAVDEDPQVAAKMVLTMAQLYVNERTSYYNTLDKDNRIEVKLVDTVIDSPLYRPNIKMNLVAGVALGALIGALIVLLLEWMSADVLATPEHVQRATGLSILGAIPVQRKRALSVSESRGGERSGGTHEGKRMTLNLATLTEPNSPVAEAYRRLRVNLVSAGKEQPLRTVLVAAASSAKDKPQVVANLGVAFAKVGQRVILVDCDLRHPGQHTLFGVGSGAGVTTAVQDEKAALPLLGTEVPGLQLLPAGPRIDIPSDLLASPAMGRLVQRLAREADIVLFDAPPVTVATDAAELATQVDGVLLTIAAGVTKREEAQRAKELLAQVGARVVGAVLMNVPAEAAVRDYLAA